MTDNALNDMLDLIAKGGDTALVMHLMLLAPQSPDALPLIAHSYSISFSDLRTAYKIAQYYHHQRALMAPAR